MIALALASAQIGAPSLAAASEDETLERPPGAREPVLLVQNVATAEPASASAPGACASGMVLVEGNYCPEVEQRCVRWLDPPKSPFAQYRCAEYAASKCLSRERKPMRFCIDRDEHVTQGATLPDNHASLVHASRACAAEGKRVCRESEWNFACEGEEMRPYPYGFSRDASACNADQTEIVDGDGKLRDLRAAPGAHPRCVSPFGVRDMSGNLEEMVALDGPALRAGMKGAYWQPSKNHCRAVQTSHDAYYGGTETGFRCCSAAAN